MRRLTLLAPAALLVAVLAACSSNAPSKPAPAAATPTATSASPSPSAPAMDAKTVVDRLQAAGLPVSNVVVQTEASDPNHLLGRPNGYTSRASFDLPGGNANAQAGDSDRGGAVEVWPDAAAAKARSAYIQGQLKANPMLGTEYDYINGGALLRITGLVVPSTAQTFQAALTKL